MALVPASGVAAAAGAMARDPRLRPAATVTKVSETSLHRNLLVRLIDSITG